MVSVTSMENSTQAYERSQNAERHRREGRIIDLGVDHRNLLNPSYIEEYETLEDVLNNNLEKYLIKYGKEPENEYSDITYPMKRIIKDVIRGLGHVHSLGITHGLLDKCIYVRRTGEMAKIAFSSSHGLFAPVDWFNLSELLNVFVKKLSKKMKFELVALQSFINGNAFHMSIEDLLSHTALFSSEEKFSLMGEIAKRVKYLPGYRAFMDSVSLRHNH